MAKTRDQKEQMMTSLLEKIQNSKSAVLVDYRGLKVKETEELRKALRVKSVEVTVAKNTLVKIALKKNGIKFDESMFKKPLAIAFAMDDEVAPAKEIDLFASKHEALEILGGILEKEMIDASAVKQLAKLPSREELLAKLVGTINAPVSGFVNVLAGNIRGLVTVLGAVRDKKA